MLTLLGVGHVFNLEAVITRFIQRRRPKVVCIELDRARYMALRNPERKQEGAFIYRMLAKFQRRMAEEYGTQAGAEMLAAADAARAVGAKLALIDVPITTDAKDMMDSLSAGEKLKLMGGALLSPFISKKRVEKEMKRFEDNPDGYLKAMEKEFPELSKNLIENRNRFMAGNIIRIHRAEPDVVAVVGDGHVPGITRLVRGLDPEVIRLKKLRVAAKRLSEGKTISALYKRPEPKPGIRGGMTSEGNKGVGFSYDYSE